jgi:hypothetical protein
MSDLSPETRRLIDMARDGDRLPPGRRALLESRFFARVAGGALVGLAAREAWAAKSAGLFGPIAKGIAGLAVVSSIGAGGYLAVRAARSDVSATIRPASGETSRTTMNPNRIADESNPSANVGSAPATQAMAAAPSRPARPAEAESPRRSNGTNAGEREPIARRANAPVATKTRTATRASTPRSDAPSTAPAAPAQAAATPTTAPATPPEPPAPAAEEPTASRMPNTLADETRLLWEADQALRAGNTSRAVSLLDEHASRYPDGSLSPERGGERVVALCKLGRIDAATVRGYLSSHPNVSLSERIQQACSRILSRGK